MKFNSQIQKKLMESLEGQPLRRVLSPEITPWASFLFGMVISMEKLKDLTGKKFGRLEVLGSIR